MGFEFSNLKKKMYTKFNNNLFSIKIYYKKKYNFFIQIYIIFLIYLFIFNICIFEIFEIYKKANIKIEYDFFVKSYSISSLFCSNYLGIGFHTNKYRYTFDDQLKVAPRYDLVYKLIQEINAHLFIGKRYNLIHYLQQLFYLSNFIIPNKFSNKEREFYNYIYNYHNTFINLICQRIFSYFDFIINTSQYNFFVLIQDLFKYLDIIFFKKLNNYEKIILQEIQNIKFFIYYNILNYYIGTELNNFAFKYNNFIKKIWGDYKYEKKYNPYTAQLYSDQPEKDKIDNEELNKIIHLLNIEYQKNYFYSYTFPRDSKINRNISTPIEIFVYKYCSKSIKDLVISEVIQDESRSINFLNNKELSFICPNSFFYLHNFQKFNIMYSVYASEQNLKNLNTVTLSSNKSSYNFKVDYILSQYFNNFFNNVNINIENREIFHNKKFNKIFEEFNTFSLNFKNNHNDFEEIINDYKNIKIKFFKIIEKNYNK